MYARYHHERELAHEPLREGKERGGYADYQRKEPRDETLRRHEIEAPLDAKRKKHAQRHKQYMGNRKRDAPARRRPDHLVYVPHQQYTPFHPFPFRAP